MLKIMKGVIDRRVLVNYRLDPECVSKILPPPFSPRLFDGHALGGICLIRFADMRPRLHAFGGGKVFPGNLTFSKFTVDETERSYHVSFTTDDDSVDVLVDEVDATFPADSVFSTIEEASEFFEKDNVGYSPSASSTLNLWVKPL